MGTKMPTSAMTMTSTSCDSNSNDKAGASSSCSSNNKKLAAQTTCECPRENVLRIDNHPKGLHVDIHRGLFSKHNSGCCNNDWYQQLLTNVRWHRVKYKSDRFQKDCETPCWTAFYGGRSEYKPYIPIPAWFQPLIDQVTSHIGNGVIFNAFLLRLYFDGKDEIAWHTDGRTFLGDEPTIASLSLGCNATFQLRRMNDVWPCPNGSKSTEGCVDTNTPIESFVLSDGDLLVMRGKTQKHWHHRVPKEKGRGVRLNINFRYVMPGVDAERGQKTYYKYMVYGDTPMNEQPRSWTFDEIMAKRGGMMNFVQRAGLKRKSNAEPHVKGGINKESSEELNTEHATALNGTTKYTDVTSEQEQHDLQCTKSQNESDTQQYLTSSEQGIDQEVFLSLPVNIQNELVSQWKSSQQQQANNDQSINRSRHANGNATKKQSASKLGKKNRSAEKGTLNLFFAKR